MKISSTRIYAVIVRQWFEFANQWSRIFDTFFWPIIDLLIWGLTFFYIEATIAAVSLSKVILGALIFASFLYSVQRDLTLGFLQEVWDRNLYNVFATPISMVEVIIGSCCTAIVKMLMLVILISSAAYGVYGFNFLDFFPLLFGGIFTITLFGIFFGILTTAFIFHFGSQVQTLTWSGMGIFMPLMCIYYPVSALPESLQMISWLLPATYVFEYVRSFVTDSQIPTLSDWVIPNLLNIFYLILTIWYFSKTFQNAKKRGWLVKMD